jgi:hypothetical protein
MKDMNSAVERLEKLEVKWGLLLDDPRFQHIKDPIRRLTLSQLFENIENFDESRINKNLLLEMVRYIVPKYLSFEFFGTVPMNGPIDLAFFLRGVDFGSEDLGFSIEQTAMPVKSRQYKKLVDDRFFNLNLYTKADRNEFITICDELVDESNEEFIGLLNSVATRGAQNTINPGEFNLLVDAVGNKLGKIKSFILNIESESCTIATTTLRGSGNFILCSPKVLSLLSTDEKFVDIENLGVIDHTELCAGNFRKKYNVYIDKNADDDYYIVGYNRYNTNSSFVVDGGVAIGLYQPVGLTKHVVAPDENFDRFDIEKSKIKIGFKTRHSTVNHPFLPKGDGNAYYRKVNVKIPY